MSLFNLEVVLSWSALFAHTIGVGRFRISGGGANSQQAHDLVTTSMRRNDVASTSHRRHVPTRFLINQCQIITFLILKSDILKNSRIELRGIVLPAPSNQIKVHLLLFYPSTWYICNFFLFHIETEGKGGWIIGVRGAPKGMLASLLNYWRGGWPPLPTPMHTCSDTKNYLIFF